MRRILDTGEGEKHQRLLERKKSFDCVWRPDVERALFIPLYCTSAYISKGPLRNAPFEVPLTSSVHRGCHYRSERYR